MLKISTIIVAGQDSAQITTTLQSVAEVSNEVLVMDIGIPNNIKTQIQQNFSTVGFLNIDKPEYVELIRQKTLEFAKNEWVLILDPDEFLSPDLVNFIKNLDPSESITHYKVPRQNYIFNKWVSHSRWWPDYQVRLFKKRSINWPQALHAQPILEGKGYIIPAFTSTNQELNAIAIVHQNYTNVSSYLEKAIRYARVDAQKSIESGESYTILTAAKKGTSEFISRFFAAQGYKDGVHGFILAFLQMFYYFLVFIFVWEADGYPEVSQTTVLKAQKQLFIATSKETFYWLSRERISKGMESTINKIKSRLLN